MGYAGGFPQKQPLLGMHPGALHAQTPAHPSLSQTLHFLLTGLGGGGALGPGGPLLPTAPLTLPFPAGVHCSMRLLRSDRFRRLVPMGLPFRHMHGVLTHVPRETPHEG